MRSFVSMDSYKIKGRGIVWVIDRGQMPSDLWDPKQLVGETIELDGKVVEVTGAGGFAIHRSPEHPYRLDFELIVK